MNRLKSILFLLLLVNSTNAQNDFKNSVLLNAYPLKLQTEDSVNIGFQKIAESIGDSRIVMLGEQDHGDGAAFLVKSALIKYLHKKKGFNIIAFETDFFSMATAWDEVLQNKISVDSAVKTSIFPVWTNCKQCNPVFEYVDQVKNSLNPIILTGFDNQLVFKNVFKKLKPALLNYIKDCELDFAKSFYYKSDFSTDIDSLLKIFRFSNDNKKKKILMLEKMRDTFKIILLQLIKKNKQADFLSMTIKNCIAFTDELISIYTKNEFLSGSIRDKQMADNLTWLIKNKYPGEKVIVWAANSHIIKNYTEAFNNKFKKAPSMGSFISADQDLKGITYTIGFTGYSGVFGRATTFEEHNIPKPNNNSIESWLHKANINDCFVDFKKITNKQDEFYMNCFNWYDFKSDWANYFDGIIYIENNFPCTKNK